MSETDPKAASLEFLQDISDARFQEALKNVADLLRPMFEEIDQMEADGVVDSVALRERSEELGKIAAEVRRGDLLILYQAATYGALVIDDGEM